MEVKTVVSMGMSRGSRGGVSLQIEDAHSGDLILLIEMTTEELGLLVTGLYGVKGVASLFTGANIASERIVERVSCKKVRREDQLKHVERDFENRFYEGGWEMQSDGTKSQQNGVDHEYIIKKYQKVIDVNKIDKFY